MTAQACGRAEKRVPLVRYQNFVADPLYTLSPAEVTGPILICIREGPFVPSPGWGKMLRMIDGHAVDALLRSGQPAAEAVAGWNSHRHGRRPAACAAFDCATHEVTRRDPVALKATALLTTWTGVVATILVMRGKVRAGEHTTRGVIVAPGPVQAARSVRM